MPGKTQGGNRDNANVIIAVLALIVAVISVAVSIFIPEIRNCVVPTRAYYAANWSDPLNGWNGVDGSWKFENGMLVNDGSKNNAIIYAPFKPDDYRLNDFAIEAEIQTDKDFEGGFGMYVRSGYWSGIQHFDSPIPINYALISVDEPGWTFSPLQNIIIDPKMISGWHAYKVEVLGNGVTLFIDNHKIISILNDQFTKGGLIGLWSKNNTKVNIRNFKVLEAPSNRCLLFQ
jgi:hypothetical protein